jgi:Galactosyltransferase
MSFSILLGTGGCCSARLPRFNPCACVQEGYTVLPNKTRAFLAAAVEHLAPDWVVKVDDDVYVWPPSPPGTTGTAHLISSHIISSHLISLHIIYDM